MNLEKLLPVCATELVMHGKLRPDSNAGSMKKNCHGESRARDDLDPIELEELPGYESVSVYVQACVGKY